MADLPLVAFPRPSVSSPAGSPETPCATTLRWQTELGEAVRVVAWLPDHSAVLALTASGRVVQLRAADGQPTWGHTAPGAGAVCLSVCPSASLVATGHLDGKLQLRTAATGKLVSEQRLGPSWVERVAWSPNGQLLAAVSGRVLHVLDGTGQPLACYQGHETSVEALCWRADSGALATASGNAARLFLVPAGDGALEPYQTLSGTRLLSALQWCPTGRLLVAGLAKGRLGSWGLPSGKHVGRRVVGRLGPVQALSWQGEGRWLASAHGPDVGVWEITRTGLPSLPTLLTHHALPVRQLAFQHRGRLLASADAGGTLALWNSPQHSTPLSAHALGSAILALNWMANDCCLAIGTAGGRVAVVTTVGN